MIRTIRSLNNFLCQMFHILFYLVVAHVMPFMNVGSDVTDTGGNYLATGAQTATFNGPFARMVDQCGAASLTQSGGKSTTYDPSISNLVYNNCYIQC